MGKSGKSAGRLGQAGRAGQSSFELIMIFMMGVTLVTVVMFYVMDLESGYSDSYKVTAAQNVVNKVADAADSVYLQGQPARIVLTVFFPEGIEEAVVSDRIVMLRISTAGGGGITDVYSATKETVSGTLPGSSGMRSIVVESMGDYVRISPI